MHQFTPIAAAFAVAWHLAIGCCGHHAHARAEACTIGAKSSEKPACCGHHEPQTKHPAAPSVPHEPCDEPACEATLAATAAPLDQPQPALQAVVGPCTAPILATAADWCDHAALRPPDDSRPRYLVLQHFLI